MTEDKKPLGAQEFLLLRGWERYVLEDEAAEYRRKRAANEELWFLADSGIRFRYSSLGISGMNMKEALGLEFGKVAKALGGFERIVALVDATQAEKLRGGNGAR